MYSVMFEGTRLAIKQGGWPLTPAKIKAGLESLRDFDANDLNRAGDGDRQGPRRRRKTRIDMWDGSKWCRSPTGSPLRRRGRRHRQGASRPSSRRAPSSERRGGAGGCRSRRAGWWTSVPASSSGVSMSG